ncbi:MAG: hypothetical protein WC937_00950 [Candidatus Omnitrophota bacterium]|jgi:hypothetical protein|nr:hypothetical protein [Candidatus Omnitrophota bacterium]MDD5517969.1 hypothetical protein [Candidatus Omnitrophota bacterium]
MGGLGFCFALIPATVLLTISFFVLISLQKMGSGRLKLFGVVVVILLWLSALLVFSSGIYASGATRGFSRCPMMGMMKGRRALMNREQAPGMPMPPMMQGSEKQR